MDAAYVYDGDGRRVQATVGGITTRFLWDGDRVALETDAAGQVIARNLYGPGQAIGRSVGPGSPAYRPDGSNTGYYLHDAHGDVRAIADPLGQVIAAFDYDPWGKVTRQTGDFDSPYRYGGEYQDGATGLYYLRPRFYAPELGRFLSEVTYAGDPAEPEPVRVHPQ